MIEDDSVSVEEVDSMHMVKKFLATEVKGLVGGSNHSWQRQLLRKDKQNLN
jgi:hypothetical protein